jgi:hypothetical protein
VLKLGRQEVPCVLYRACLHKKKGFLPYLNWTLKRKEVISKRRQCSSLSHGASNDGPVPITTSCNVVILSLCFTKHITNKAYRGTAIDPITESENDKLCVRSRRMVSFSLESLYLRRKRPQFQLHTRLGDLNTLEKNSLSLPGIEPQFLGRLDSS